MREKLFPLLQVEEVSCFNRKKTLLDQVSFSLNSGESLGILGLRQSGQSLLLHVLAGAVRIQSGKLTLKGYTPKQGKRFYQNIGWVTEQPSLFPDLRVCENLDLLASLKNVPTTSDMHALVERLDLSPYLKEQAGELSPGVYQRLALTCALLNQPALLLIDDVLHGIDPSSLTLIQQEIQRFLEADGALIWNVHTPEDLATMQHTAWMENGHLEILPRSEVAARWHTPNLGQSSLEVGETQL